MIQTILFDLDGTLVDTEPAAARAVLEAFSEWGIEADPADARYVTGRTWEVAFQYLFGKYRVPVPPEKAAERMMERYREALRREVTVIPGAIEAVQALSREFRLALVSGSHRSEILFILDRLAIRDRFGAIVGAEDYRRSKPAPDAYLRGLELLGASPQNGLVFEDSEPGIESARASGLFVVAVTCANHYGHDKALAHEEIPDFRGIDPAWVREFSRRVGA